MPDTLLHPALREVRRVMFLVRGTMGFNLGLLAFTYNVFLFNKFGGAKNPNALRCIVMLLIISEILIILSEVPTGAIGDLLGRKKAVVVSFILVSCNEFLRSWLPFISSSYVIFALACAAEVCFALSFTFMSGNFFAWVVDTVRLQGIEGGHGPLLARAFRVMFAAQIFGAALGITLYLTGYIFFSFAIAGTLSIVCAVYCGVMMKETEGMRFHMGPIFLKSSTARIKTIIFTGGKIIMQTPAVLYLVLAYGSYRLLVDVVDYLWPTAMSVSYGIHKMSYAWFLIIFLILTLSYAGARAAERITRTLDQTKERITKSANVRLWWWFFSIALLAGSCIATVGLKSLTGKVALPLFLFAIPLFKCGFGFLTPVFNTLLNNYIPPQHSEQRATIMSFASMFASLLTVFLLFPSSGPSAENMTVGWIIPSGLLLGTMLILHFFMRSYQRKTGELQAKLGSSSVEVCGEG